MRRRIRKMRRVERRGVVSTRAESSSSLNVVLPSKFSARTTRVGSFSSHSHLLPARRRARIAATIIRAAATSGAHEPTASNRRCINRRARGRRAIDEATVVTARADERRALEEYARRRRTPAAPAATPTPIAGSSSPRAQRASVVILAHRRTRRADRSLQAFLPREPRGHV